MSDLSLTFSITDSEMGQMRFQSFWRCSPAPPKNQQSKLAVFDGGRGSSFLPPLSPFFLLSSAPAPPLCLPLLSSPPTPFDASFDTVRFYP